MGLFDAFKKKQCDICGGEIGMLGNRKLEDGNMCKTCARKLSPWFDERRHSTIAQINEQLAYREANKDSVAAFRVTRVFGESTKLYLDEDAGVFLVTDEPMKKWAEDNPDVVAFGDVTGVDVDVDEDRTEHGKDGQDPVRIDEAVEGELVAFEDLHPEETGNGQSEESGPEIDVHTLLHTAPPAAAAFFLRR